MAATITSPMAADYQSWKFEKPQTQTFGSPASDMSASTFSEHADKVRVDPTMDDIRAVIEAQKKVGFAEQYQSSEEALSPMLDEDEATDTAEADDEDTTDEEEAWVYSGHVKLDIAVALTVVSVGKPKIVNLPPRWANFRSREQMMPARSVSNPPAVPARAMARAQAPRLNTHFSAMSAPIEESAASQNSAVDDTISPKQRNRMTSIYGAPSNFSTTTLTPPTSDHNSDSPTPSFLQSDPFDNPKPKKPGHSRLRSFSSKFKKSNANEYTEQEKQTKQSRRLSLNRPDTPPNYFDSPPIQQVSLIAPLKTQPSSQRKFPKMVARGANEIAPTIQLPPCPKTYDQEMSPIARSNTVASTASASSPRRSPTFVRKRRSMMMGIDN